MATQFEVIWTDNALLRFQNAIGYYLERNQSNSYPLRLQQEVDRVLAIVATFPRIGRILNNGKTRVVLIGKFELLYELDAERIIIVDFWDPQNNPNKRRDREE